MSKIAQQLRASGVAQVIVVLQDTEGLAAGSNRRTVDSLRKHFTTSELDQHSAIIDDGFVAAASFSRATSPAARRVATTARTVRRAGQPVRYFPNLGIAYGTVDRAGLAALKADARVSNVTGAPRLRLIRPTHQKTVRLARKVTWGIAALEIPALWKEGLTGKGVVVAHLDTGADGKHRALKDAFDAFLVTDRLGTPQTGRTDPYDTEDHGTHTAGTLVGRPDKRSGKSIGVAHGATIASAIVIEGGDSVARVLAGMDWALGRRAKVLSMSLGFEGYIDDFLPITRILRARGMLPVIAAGNEGPGSTRSPGNYPEALSVGWANRDDSVDPDSSSQHFRRRRQPIVPDLVAPGGDVVSAAPGGGYQEMSGTSMATPHVAGLAALLWEAEPAATVDQIEKAIVASCTPLPRVSKARQGHGLPNGPTALEKLRGDA